MKSVKTKELAKRIVMHITEGLADPKDEETRQVIEDVADMINEDLVKMLQEKLDE